MTPSFSKHVERPVTTLSAQMPVDGRGRLIADAVDGPQFVQ